MRDVRLREERPSTNYGLVFAIGLTVVVAIYSWFMSKPEALAKIPGMSHYQGHHYEKTNEQKRRDAHEKEAEAHGHIPDVDRDALRMLLEARR